MIISVCHEKSDELIEIAEQEGYQARTEYGPFEHTPPSNTRNRRNFDYQLLKELSFPEVVKSAERIRVKIYRNLLIQNDRTNICTLLTLPAKKPTSTMSLLHAVMDYREKYPPHDDSRYFIGACGPMSEEFKRLCSNKYGIKVETPHFGDGVSFYHQVAVRKDIVIDWTVRQFGKYENYPYPYIYKIGKGIFGGGVVKRDKNDRSKLISHLTHHETQNC